MKAITTGRLPEFARKELEALGLSVEAFSQDALCDEQAFCDAISDASFYFSGGYETATRRVIEHGKSLKGIVFLGADCGEYIDAVAAAERGVPVSTTPGANAASVAEFTIGLFIDTCRKITSSGHSFMAAAEGFGTVNTFASRTVGLLGFGNIGSKVASICAKGFGMSVKYWSRGGPKPSDDASIQWMTLVDLLRTCDLVSVHIPAAAGTIISAEMLALMPPGAVLINTSYANAVDASALMVGLTSGAISCAAYDGFYDDSMCDDATQKALLALMPERLIVTPQIAWRTYQADDYAYRQAIDATRAILRGDKPASMVIAV